MNNKIRYVLLDRDGVINKKKQKGKYITNWKEFKFIKKNINALELLQKKNYKFIIITNQAGVSKKFLTKKKLNEIHKKMRLNLLKLGIKITEIYVCTHQDSDKCFCRKPKPGLFHKASKKYKFNLNSTLYIGDEVRDCLAAYNSGCKSILINKSKFFKKLNNLNKPICIKKNIFESIDCIENFYENK